MASPGRQNMYSSATGEFEGDEIPNNDVNTITSFLQSRLSQDKVFTRIGSRCLVAVRPARGLPIFSDTTSKEYAEDAKTPSKQTNYNQPVQQLAPHAFEISASAYLHALRAKMDQSIILLGESASGKSEIYKMLTRNLCDLSKSSKKKSKIHSNLLKIDTVMSAFGNATTPHNLDASCYTKYTEMQFDSKGKMVGVKLIEYLLEKSRVTGPLDRGKTFHIFYYLLEGATHEERVQWHLSDPAHFAFLNGSKMAGFAQGKGVNAMAVIRDNLKSLGIGHRQQAQIWQLLAAILHLGNIQFQDPRSDREACSIRNYPQMQMVAEMLGVHPSALAGILTSRTKTVGRDNVSTFLNAHDASIQRDYFARSLYAVCFGWIVEQINQKLCAPDAEWSNFVSILETPGFAGLGVNGNDFHRLLVNYANERLYQHTMVELFESPKEAFIAQEIAFPESSTYNSNNEILAVLAAPRNGVLPLIDTESAHFGSDLNITAKIYEEHLDSGIIISASSKNMAHSFGIHHYAGIVDYDSHGFGQLDSDILQSDFVTLVRGNPENPGTSNPFLRNLFSDQLIATRTAVNSSTVVTAITKTRTPSLRRKNPKARDEEVGLDPSATVGHMFRVAYSSLLDTLSSTQPWFIYCIKPFEGLNGKVNTETIKRQVTAYDLGALYGNPSTLYTSTYSFASFVNRYKPILSLYDRDPKLACEAMIRYKNWKPTDCVVGTTAIFLAERHWKDLELKLKEKEDAEEAAKNPPRPSADSGARSSFQSARADAENMLNDAFAPRKPNYAESMDGTEMSDDDNASHFDSEFEFSGKVGDVEMAKTKSKDAAEKPKKIIPPPVLREPTSLRKKWLCFTWSTTFCCFPFLLSCCGLKQKERQIAWREKVALCIIVAFMNAFVLFIIIGIGYIICPPNKDQSPGEISARNNADSRAAVFLFGGYYLINSIIANHDTNYLPQAVAAVQYWESSVLGQDVTYMFPKEDFATSYCQIPMPTGFKIKPDMQKTYWVQHGANTQNVGTDFFPQLKKYYGGRVVISVPILNDAIKSGAQNNYMIINDKVYDVSPFTDLARNPSQTKGYFLGDFFTNATNYYVKQSFVGDATAQFNLLKASNPTQYNQIMTCMDNLFIYGWVDHRNDLICIIPNYILLAASIILVSVIGFKFLAALQFPGKKTPEDHDKFVICQVPCYTEGDGSLHRTIDSLANLRYDDKHKLIFIVCDGMIIGSGNDRPTPRIVLDILGVDSSVDPEPVAFQSLGDNNQQLNYAKVYSGLYELQGHVVPFIVVVKVGKPSERNRPGNRGKRDSQLVLMRFLMRVHFNQAMSPLELEMYHHMKNVIGVDPSFYEYVFMVDADTEVQEDSLNHLVSHFTRDGRIAGTCGETEISNDKKSFTSMIQVYEYFISHHLAKAFESIFGSVTCLPGCFCMYRIRTPRGVPVLVNPGLIADYSENQVDTLHLRNLLHLGEDRYLTTLMMKHFPGMRTTFCPDAHCKTVAPDTWNVLLSQRRRWINSTVHNLFELLRLGELCGFCCISLRFVVFIDLLATFIQPASLIYIVYLVYMVASNSLTNVPLISLIMLGCVYGFQYLLGIPLFGFYIPLYSFWHFDDFTWGNTRKVIEDEKAASHQVEEEYFDPDSVPLVKWSDYESKRIEESQSSGTKSKESTGYGYSNSYGTSAPSVYSDDNSQYGASRVDTVNVANFPSDEELLMEIKHILSTTDLMKVTKKSVRDRLSQLFGVDVTPRKEYIHSCIDGILKGEL
ncbi:hypothetical protein HK103_007232 [Boothiomyces macroporosus]|uniref:chitin synthase n=1 Tax=Boothiomyces macroporosus TaxID=261099 RepID=A0AAD5UC93_9FUNG|nr:hypothetical protein HK103_007232 [Boothiomyces macroporosus]